MEHRRIDVRFYYISLFFTVFSFTLFMYKKLNVAEETASDN
jgi:hypothetical protein